MTSTYIIAEAGVNHNGHLDLAIQLCDAAKAASANAVKFQTFKTEKVLTRSVSLAEYQEKNIGTGKTQFEMVKALELAYNDFRLLKKHCHKIGIDFLSTPDEEDSLEFLVEELEMEVIKIGSGEVTNIPFLRAIGRKQKPVILSTGMATLGEVDRAIDELLGAGASELTVLHCTTNYPCPMGEVNLRAMHALSEAFGLPYGYSDHTKGIEISLAAVALGASVIEKHFTLDRSMIGPDHAASLEPSELKDMVSSIRNIEMALGDGRKRPNKSELAIRNVVRRSIVASRSIAAGEHYSPENVTVKRAGGNGIPAELWDQAIGYRAPRAYEVDETVDFQ